MKKILLNFASFCALGTCAQAAGVLSSGFDSNTVSGTTASDIEWTTELGVTLNGGGDLTSLNGADFGVLGNISTADNLAVNLNMNSGDRTIQRGFSVGFNLSNPIQLSNLNVLTGQVNASGGNQNFSSDVRFQIDAVAGGLTVVSGEILQADFLPGEAILPFDFALSETLPAGDYILSVGQNNLTGGGAFAIFDGLTLEGDAVPEPGSALLAGLGLMTLLGCRRR